MNGHYGHQNQGPYGYHGPYGQLDDDQFSLVNYRGQFMGGPGEQPGGFPGFFPPGQGPGSGPGPGFPGFPPGQGPGPGFPGQPGFPPGQGGPGFPGQGPGGGPPQGPPPSFTPQQGPQVGVQAVDPGAIRRCLFRYTFIWLDNRQRFWFYPTFVGRRSVSGYRWTGFFWVYYGVDLNRIDSFQCY